SSCRARARRKSYRATRSGITWRRSGATCARKRAAACATTRPIAEAARHDRAGAAQSRAAGARPGHADCVRSCRRSPHSCRRGEPLHRADALADRGRVPARHCRRGHPAPLSRHRARSILGDRAARAVRRRHRRAALSRQTAARCDRDLGRRDGLRADSADVPAVPRHLRPQRDHHHHDGLCRRPARGHSEDHRGLGRHAPRAGRCRAQFQAHRSAAVLEDLLSRRPADDVRGLTSRHDLRPDQYRRGRVPDQFRRAWPTDQRSRRALRPARHLRGDLLRHSRQRLLLLCSRQSREMAETRPVPAPAAPFANPVTLVRIAIVAGVLVVWEAVAASGLLFRDVVPSLPLIGRAVAELRADNTYYWHLGVTAGEIGPGLLIGGLSGLAVGILLGSNKLLSRAFEAYLYYLGPPPKIIFFPVMIMWFGVGPGSKVAMGTISCFFPVALSAAAGMREINPVLIRVGRSFRAGVWQMVTKIYLPAMRLPVINGVR